MSKRSKQYLPKERTEYNPVRSELGFGAANPKTDPVVVNNLVTAEFDYTEEIENKTSKNQKK